MLNVLEKNCKLVNIIKKIYALNHVQKSICGNKLQNEKVGHKIQYILQKTLQCRKRTIQYM